VNEDQIRSSLRGIEGSIATVDAALRLASNLNDISSLNDQMVSLRAEQTRLQLELANLEAAKITVAPMTGTMLVRLAPIAPKPKKMSAEDKKAAKHATKKLDAAIADRRVVVAALDHSSEVLGHIDTLRKLTS
jgi:hypothetical protein